MPLLLAGCAAYVASWVWAWLRLPPRVPLHFGASGAVDRWGSRAEALTTFAVAGLVVAAVVGLGLLAVRRSRWRWVNVPHKTWWTATAEREQRLRAMLGRDLGGIGGATMLLLAFLVLATLAAARAPEPALPVWALAGVGLYVVGVLGWAVLAVTRRYRPDA